MQLDLAGVSTSEIMDAQRAIECLAAELAAVNSTAEDHARLRELIVDAEDKIDDVVAFTRSSREFHLAVAEASHNRVLVVQLISLQHVSWPARNPTLTSKVARRILDVHKELTSLIEIRDAAGARRLMDDHVKMIAARRVAEHATSAQRSKTAAEQTQRTGNQQSERSTAWPGEIHHRAALPAAGMGRRREGLLLGDEGPTTSSRNWSNDRWRAPLKGDKVAPCSRLSAAAV